MAKMIAFDQEARDAIKRGVGKLAKTVCSTLGPCGHTVLISKSFGAPTVAKDGITVANELGPATPWHLSRFFPANKMMDLPPTPISTLRQAQEIGHEAGLRYVYLGNTDEPTNTFCHVCGELLIGVTAFGVVGHHVGPKSNCPTCGTPVAGIGMAGE